MNNPGTRLALQLLKRLLQEGDSSFSALSPADFPDGDGKPLYSQSTFLRTVRLLEQEGWITTADRGRISLSEGVESLLCGYTSKRTSSVRVEPFVRRLAESTGESAAFAIWSQEGIRFTSTWVMPDSFSYIPVGEINRFNLHNGFNLTSLAYLTKKERHRSFEKSEALRLIDTVEELEELCTRIRREGFLEWEDKAQRITVPVFHPGGLFAGVLGISFFGKSHSPEVRSPLRLKVLKAAEDITRMLAL